MRNLPAIKERHCGRYIGLVQTTRPTALSPGSEQLVVNPEAVRMSEKSTTRETGWLRGGPAEPHRELLLGARRQLRHSRPTSVVPESLRRPHE